MAVEMRKQNPSQEGDEGSHKAGLERETSWMKADHLTQGQPVQTEWTWKLQERISPEANLVL